MKDIRIITWICHVHIPKLIINILHKQFFRGEKKRTARLTLQPNVLLLLSDPSFYTVAFMSLLQ